jgi:type I restriction enzyme S subunit
MAKYEDAMKLNKGDLPEGWTWATVEMVGDVLLGRQRAPQYLTGKWSHSYLRVANIKDDRIDFDDVETMDFDPEHFAKYCLEPGDILVSEGQSPDRVGESAIYGGGLDGLCFQKTLHRFRPVPSGPSSKFAQIVFRAHVKQGVFRKMASITTNIAHLTLEKFQAAPFPLPPLAEQARIVAEVDRLLSVADTTEQAVRAQLARARRLRQAVLKRAFEGKLVPQEAHEPASAPVAQVAQVEQPTSKRGAAPATPTFHVVPTTAPSIGEVLRDFRVGQGLSARTFASRFELDTDHVAKLESITAPFEPERMTAMREAVRAVPPSLRAGQAKRILDELLATLHTKPTEEDWITAQAARKSP